MQRLLPVASDGRVHGPAHLAVVRWGSSAGVRKSGVKGTADLRLSWGRQRHAEVCFPIPGTGGADPKPSVALFRASGRSARETVVRELGREIPARG